MMILWLVQELRCQISDHNGKKIQDAMYKSVNCDRKLKIIVYLS
jgi:hypothetical protein